MFYLICIHLSFRKLWFFISNNYWRSAEDGQAGTFGWLSIPEGKLRENTNNFFGKLTFTLGQNHTFSLSGTYDKFLNQTGGIGLPERYKEKLLFPSGRAEEMAAKLYYLMTCSEEERYEIGQELRDMVVRNHSAGALAAKIKSIIIELANKERLRCV